jgi:very-short-patch-repair endonuclease
MSELEAMFEWHIRGLRLPVAVREYRFHAKRRWKFDFAWPDRMVALEIEGGTWTNGRHTRGLGFTADCEKYNEACTMGWKIIRVTGDQVRNGKAVEWITKLLKGQDK